MFIASKYEEIYPPTASDFVHITNNTYTKQQLLQMEQKMLQSLEFSVGVHSQFRFLQRMVKISNKDSNPLIFNFAQYFIELALLDYSMLQFNNSTLAASSLYLSLKLGNHMQSASEQRPTNVPQVHSPPKISWDKELQE